MMSKTITMQKTLKKKTMIKGFGIYKEYTIPMTVTQNETF